MYRPSIFTALVGAGLFLSHPAIGQSTSAQNEAMRRAVGGLQLRSIGPAVMGGRIADIAIHPARRSTWYLAVGSGGVWKTTNAGTTWKPIFDDQPVYSIGVVTIDPNNPDVVWVGTGENVSGRHVGWGDGVYKSNDGGASWTRVGLETSEHIGKILVDPRDSDVVFVAAEGPLWSSGGERGVYKTTDGGETWRAVLEIDAETGVTDLEFHPSNPDVMYAASYQRRRHIWALMAGGPRSGIHKSTDGGETWDRVTTGLPSGDMGKIGLAVTPADPNIVYATIEAHDDERGFYRSRDRGESWEHRNPYISGGTGPHYYQEIEASPTNPDLVYQMDVFFHVTRDGGATFDYLGTGREKHSDNHALWIDPDDGNHLIAGTDAGLYETFDEGTTWRHFPNLPISQFYKLALDNGEPFYDILGGAQDLGTLLGPSRTMNVEGVRNRDWYAPMGADGYAVAIDPTDRNTLYLQTQQGNLYRYHRPSEEALDIKPQPNPGDPPERWNWDSPIIISPHNSNRLYFASQRLWRSENQGNTWTPISTDLTRDQNRYEMPTFGRVASVNALYGNTAMSLYGTITSVTESPVSEDVIYVGTDDGLIQVTENGGETWRVGGPLPEVPDLSFINDVEASQHDADVVFAIVDAHKIGDFTPYVLRSNDRGTSWSSVAGDLPENTIAWAIEQDHVDPNLLFLATEFGIYVTTNGGTNWMLLSGGVPTIAFRDIELQRRDGDLVGATFGRGFYVLDDYTPLRHLNTELLADQSVLFPVRDAWWYVPYVPMQARGKPTLGSTDYTGDNPPFGATFTFYLNEVPQTSRQSRRASEDSLRGQAVDIPFPGWDVLETESTESSPRVFVVVRNALGEAVRTIAAPAERGLHRVSWDLRRPAPNPVNLTTPGFSPPWVQPPRGPLVPPGPYRAELMLVTRTGVTALSEPQEFMVKPVPNTPANTDFTVVAQFQQETSELMRRVSGAGQEISRAQNRLTHMRAALMETPAASPSLFVSLDDLGASLQALRTRLNGDRIRQSFSEATSPSIQGRVGRVVGGHWNTRQTPTDTHRENLRIARADFSQFRQDLERVLETELVQLEEALEAAGAPWTPGRKLPN